MSSSSEQAAAEAIMKSHPDLKVMSESSKTKRWVTVVTTSEAVGAVALSLRDKLGYVSPIACGGVDYPKEGIIQLVYYVSNPETKVLLLLKFNVPRDAPRVKSLCPVWGGMDFHEREAYEMFGIEFEGHPNMIPFLLPPDWRGGHPLRKDFKGEGTQ